MTAVLFAVALAAAVPAALRVAHRMAGQGWRRPVCAVVVLATGAALVPLAAALVGLGTSAPALAAVTLAAAAGAAAAAGPPAVGVLAELHERAREAAVPARVLCGLAGGWALALALHGLVTAEIRTDQFHLAEVVIWLQQGTPGSVELVATEWPAGAYPLANELVLTWGVGIARGFAPAALWTGVLGATLLVATYHGLRERGAPVAGAATAAAAGLLLVAAIIQLEGAGTDLASVAWLAAAAALVAHPDPARRAPVAALLALGLAIGTKTNTAFLGLLLVAVPCWAARRRIGPVEAAALVAAAGLALAWPLRNLVLHGSPLWPFTSLAGLGDPVPYILDELQNRFVLDPAGTVEAHLREHPFDLVRAALPLAGLLAVLARRRDRDAVRLALVAAAGAVVWAVSPLSGATEFGGAGKTAILHYLLPPLVVAVAAMGLAWRDDRLARAALVATVVACATAVPRGHPFGAAGALAAVAVAAAGGATAWRWAPRRAIHPAAAAAAAAVLVASGGLFAHDRYTSTADVTTDGVLRWLNAQPAYRELDQPVRANWALDARLAGPGLEHPIAMLPVRASCADVRRARRGAWLVVARAGFLGPSARFADAEACLTLEAAAYADDHYAVYAPQ